MSNPRDKAKRSKRIEKDDSVMDKRLKVAKAHKFTGLERNRFKKRHPLDCGQTKCGVCHSYKKYGEEKLVEKREKQKDKFED